MKKTAPVIIEHEGQKYMRMNHAMRLRDACLGLVDTLESLYEELLPKEKRASLVVNGMKKLRYRLEHFPEGEKDD